MDDDYLKNDDFFHGFAAPLNIEFYNEPLWTWFVFIMAITLFLKAWSNVLNVLENGV
jgi:hypothetical protein